MDNQPKNLVDRNEEGFILNESGSSVKTDDSEKKKNVTVEQGSKSDPQLSEMDGIKKGGVEPKHYPDEKSRTGA